MELWGDRTVEKKQVLILFLIIISLIFASPKMMAQEDTMSEIEEKLTGISEEEREILEDLFIQAQEIEELERERIKLIEEIETLGDGIENLEDLIEEETKSYEDKLYVLKQVLRSYQKMGPSSYIEIILDADSITNLLRRINTLRDLTKNTGELLESIEKSKEKLLSEKMNLNVKLAQVEEKEEELKKTLDEKQERIDELEEYLASLEGDREYYKERLESLIKMMDELIALFSDIRSDFKNIMEEGDLHEDQVEGKLTSKGIKGTIKEEVFNKIIKDNSKLPEIIFHFYPGKVDMELPEKNLFLTGTFIIEDEQNIRYEVEEGSFYGMVLKRESIEEFFKDGYLTLNLEPIIWKNTLKVIEIHEGYLELTVGIKLF